MSCAFQLPSSATSKMGNIFFFTVGLWIQQVKWAPLKKIVLKQNSCFL